MKSLSCISLSRPESMDSDTPTHPHYVSIDSSKDDSKTTVLGHKGPKIQTIVEVLRCEWGRPGASSAHSGDEDLGPKKGWTPIQYASFHNREGALLHFLRAGQSPDDVAGTGQPPLCIAVAAGHVGIVKILCTAGANSASATKEKGETPLHIAIRDGRTDIVDILLAHGPDMKARTLQSLETPLHYAAGKPGSLATIVSLLKSGASYEALDSEGRTPAEVAINASNIPGAVAMINEARGNRRKLAKEKDMLLRKVEKADTRFSMNNELIADIFEAGCDPDSTVLIEAIKRNDTSLAEMFLAKGADPDRATATGLKPIFAALSCSSAHMVHLLVKHGVDVMVRDSDGLTVLQAAFESPSAQDKEAISGIFDALLSKGADAKVAYPDGKTLLHRAVGPGFGLAKVALRLLQHGVKIHQQDDAGCTALHLASHSKSCVEVLLKHRANPKLLNFNELTPLLHTITSIAKDSEPDLEALVKASDLRTTDKDSKTALHIAAERGLDRTVRVLLKYRAETTVVDAQGQTPLLLAVLKHRWSTVPLVATQPGLNCWDREGMTALHHIAMSAPQSKASWKDIATAASRFCEKGVSRSMRDRSGATPLIQAVKTLPEEGVSVLEALLADGPRSNCVGHMDHKQRSALHFAATLGKPIFVSALLKNGATFTFKEWAPSKGPIQPNTAADKQTLKHFAEYEWMKRAAMLHRHSGSATSVSVLPQVLRVKDVKELLTMGLDPNVLPNSPNTKSTRSLLWTILNQTLVQPPLPPTYLYDVCKVLFEFGADANAMTAHNSNITVQLSDKIPSARHPLTFLLEQYPTVDIDLIVLFLDNSSNLKTASTFYDGCLPLHSAVKANRMDVVDEFLTRRADANPNDTKQRTPIFVAAEKGFWEVTDALLRCGAKVNIQDAEGNSPLHCAVTGSCPRLVSSLLRAGAKVMVKNQKESAPLDCVQEDAAEKDKSKIIAMLKSAGEQEKKENERTQRQKQLEEEAKKEGKERMRKEREQMRKTSNISTLRSASTDSFAFAHFAPESPRSPSTKPDPRLSPTTSLPKQPKDNSKTPQVTTPRPAPDTEKPLPVPRVDSGVMYATSNTKPLPVLDRNKTTFSSNPIEKVEKSDELAGWLAMSKMLDKL